MNLSQLGFITKFLNAPKINWQEYKRLYEKDMSYEKPPTLDASHLPTIRAMMKELENLVLPIRQFPQQQNILSQEILKSALAHRIKDDLGEIGGRLRDAVFQEDLGGFPLDVILEAMKSWRQKQPYFPATSDIVKLAEKLLFARKQQIMKLKVLEEKILKSHSLQHQENITTNQTVSN